MAALMFVLLLAVQVVFGNNEKPRRILLSDQSYVESELGKMHATIRDLTTKLKYLTDLVNRTDCNGGMFSIPTCHSHYTSCPNGFVRHNDSCYKFYNQLMSWTEALTYCHAVGSHLVRTETRAEFDFLRGWILSIKSEFTTDGAYIGALQGHSKGEWEWVEIATPMTNIPWGAGQPDMNARDDCIVIWKGHNYYYGDATCDLKANFICEIDMIQTA